MPRAWTGQFPGHGLVSAPHTNLSVPGRVVAARSLPVLLAGDALHRAGQDGGDDGPHGYHRPPDAPELVSVRKQALERLKRLRAFQAY